MNSLLSLQIDLLIQAHKDGKKLWVEQVEKMKQFENSAEWEGEINHISYTSRRTDDNRLENLAYFEYSPSGGGHTRMMLYQKTLAVSMSDLDKIIILPSKREGFTWTVRVLLGWPGENAQWSISNVA